MKTGSLIALNIVTALLLAHAVPPSASAQIQPGILFRIYPAGQILAFQLSTESASSSEFRFFAGYNRTRRRDWGKHDDERGGGPGAGVEFIRFGDNGRDRWFYGFRTEAWSLNIDWRQGSTSGESRVLVLQPIALAGYRFSPGSLKADVSVSLGREFNTRTRGEAVGEGMILLGGVSLSY
jgi:hypothetical protein